MSKKSTRSPLTTSKAVSDIDAYLGYWIRYVSNQVTTAFQQRLAQLDTTVAEWLVLRFLLTHAPCSLTKLSTEMGIDKGGISRLSDRLEKRGLIMRTIDPNDRRLYSVELTSAGARLVPKLARLADENDEYFFGHLSKKQIDEMKHALKEIVNRFGFDKRPID